MSYQKKIIIIFGLIFCFFVQIIPVIRSGLTYSYGIGFWGPAGHDGVWHLSLINHIDNPVNIELPVYAGEKLVNYHPFFDILINLFSRISRLPSSLWLFQIFPVVSSIIFIYLSYRFGLKIFKRHSAAMLLTFLNCLANSFGFLISIFKYGNFSGESLFWAMQSPSNQINPPFLLSLIFILLILHILSDYKNFQSLSLPHSIALIVILVLLPITKAYSSLVGFGIFALYSLKTYLTHHRYGNLIALAISISIAYVVFRHFNPSSSSLIVFSPFWFLNTLVASPDKLYFPRLSSFLSNTPVYDPRHIIAIISLFAIFVAGNFSWRIIGFFITTKRLFPEIIFLVLIIILTLIPTFFIQQNTGWNTIQFIYYAMFLANFLLTSHLLSRYKHTVTKVILFLLITSSLVSFAGMLPNYIGRMPPSYLPAGEKEALDFLSLQPKGTVLTVPYDPYLKNNFSSAPIPLYAYETTSYVSAYSRQPTFFEDEMNLGNSAYDYQARRQQSLQFFRQSNIYQDRGFLINNNIDYIYLAGMQKQLFPLDNQNLYITPIYENQQSLIYRVQR